MKAIIVTDREAEAILLGLEEIIYDYGTPECPVVPLTKEELQHLHEKLKQAK